MKMDGEAILDRVLAIMQANLNTQISAIEAEKGALTPTLAAIDSTAYHCQTWSDKVLNITPAIFYGIEDVATIDGGQGAAKQYKIFAEVIVNDNGQTNDVWRRIARYARALEEIFSDNWREIDSASRIKIETVRPISFKLELDSSSEIKVGGVSLLIAVF